MVVSFVLQMCVAFGFSFTQFVGVWFTYSPVPILVGGLSGILVGSLMRDVRYLWTFCLAGLSMVIGEFLGVLYIYDPFLELYPGRYRLFGMLGPLVAGVSVEIVLFGLMLVLHRLRKHGRQGE